MDIIWMLGALFSAIMLLVFFLFFLHDKLTYDDVDPVNVMGMLGMIALLVFCVNKSSLRGYFELPGIREELYVEAHELVDSGWSVYLDGSEVSADTIEIDAYCISDINYDLRYVKLNTTGDNLELSERVWGKK